MSQALPLLASVYVLVFIFILIFGVVGLMAFTNAYHYICLQVGGGEGSWE